MKYKTPVIFSFFSYREIQTRQVKKKEIRTRNWNGVANVYKRDIETINRSFPLFRFVRRIMFQPYTVNEIPDGFREVKYSRYIYVVRCYIYEVVFF